MYMTHRTVGSVVPVAVRHVSPKIPVAARGGGRAVGRATARRLETSRGQPDNMKTTAVGQPDNMKTTAVGRATARRPETSRGQPGDMKTTAAAAARPMDSQTTRRRRLPPR